MNEWNELKKAHYGSDTCVLSEFGTIDFSPEKLKKIEGVEKLSYDEYLEIQRKSAKDCRHYFEMCYYEMALGFKGQIEKKNSKNVCFKRIYVEGMYRDGTCFDGKEDHVWLPINGFEEYEVGDCLSFFAEVYLYLKTSNGKKIDYGLRNPEGIKKIEAYELPSDDELLMQSINSIICETCFLNKQCYGGYCLKNKDELKAIRKDMLKLAKAKQCYYICNAEGSSNTSFFCICRAASCNGLAYSSII